MDRLPKLTEILREKTPRFTTDSFEENIAGMHVAGEFLSNLISNLGFFGKKLVYRN